MKKNEKANSTVPFGYCSKCNKHVKEIVNKPNTSFVEIRKWNKDCYELTTTNADYLDWISYCGECRTEIGF